MYEHMYKYFRYRCLGFHCGACFVYVLVHDVNIVPYQVIICMERKPTRISMNVMATIGAKCITFFYIYYLIDIGYGNGNAETAQSQVICINACCNPHNFFAIFEDYLGSFCQSNQGYVVCTREFWCVGNNTCIDIFVHKFIRCHNHAEWRYIQSIL